MFNYSVILLGATISVSLFIRIIDVCGALEVTSSSSTGVASEDLLFQQKRPIDLEISDIRLALLGDSDKAPDPEQENELNYLIETRKLYLEQHISDFYKPVSRIQPQTNYEDDYYDEQVCGILHHRPRRIGNHSEENETQSVLPEGVLPEGCEVLKDNIVGHAPSILCSGQDIVVIPSLPPRLTDLHISGTRVAVVSRSNFGNVTIQNILLINNQITDIEPWAFANVNGITTLEIMDNQLPFLAFDIYNGLTDARTLMLDGNQISFRIYENCSAREVEKIPRVLPNLSILTLNRNPLELIPAQMFAGLRDSDLTMLNMENCALEFIHEEAFVYLPKLEILNISRNPRLMLKLVTALKGLANSPLRVLRMQYNNLYYFPTEAISYVQDHLQTLDLANNYISFLRKVEMPALKKLKTLDLSNCNMQSIEPGTFDELTTLVELFLNSNMLKQIHPFGPLPNLHALNLSAQYIEGENNAAYHNFQIPDSAFANLTGLTSLFLHNMRVERVKIGTFEGLTSLQTLTLEYTFLESIEDRSFQDLGSLVNLRLQGNPNLASINSLSFFGLNNLRNLYLSDCGIKFPNISEPEKARRDNEELALTPDPEKPFRYLPALEKLDLSNNNITKLYSLLFSSNPNLTKVYLSGNHIEAWTEPVFRANHTRNRVQDPVFDSKHKELLISYNNVAFFTQAMADDLLSLYPNTVDFSGNTIACNKGACILRDLMNLPNDTDLVNEEEGPLKDTIWEDRENYFCIDYINGTEELVNIDEVTDEICNKTARIGGENPSPSSGGLLEGSPSWLLVTIVSVSCGTAIVVAAVVGYKQRAQIRYLLFRAKMNVSKLPRKAKISTTLDLIQFDYDIFLSYHNEDREFIADKFLPQVEVIEGDGGFRVCLHERDFEAGMPITENIVESVDRSRKVVIVVSKKYLESQWCTFEMNLAYHRLVELRRTSFVVILYEEIPSQYRTKVLNYLMKSRTYLQWPGNKASAEEYELFWNRLRRSLKSGD